MLDKKGDWVEDVGRLGLMLHSPLESVEHEMLFFFFFFFLTEQVRTARWPLFSEIPPRMLNKLRLTNVKMGGVMVSLR